MTPRQTRESVLLATADSSAGATRHSLRGHKRPDKASWSATCGSPIGSRRQRRNGSTLPCRDFRRCGQSRSAFFWRAYVHVRLQRFGQQIRRRFDARHRSERRARALARLPRHGKQGVRDSRCARVRRNDTAPGTHKFAQVDGTRNHGVVLQHGRARPATKSNGVAARAACECVLGGTLLIFGVHASHCVHAQRNDIASRTRVFARAAEMPLGAGRHFQGLTQMQVLRLLQIVQEV